MLSRTLEGRSPQARELELAAEILVDCSGEISVAQAINEAKRLTKYAD